MQINYQVLPHKEINKKTLLEICLLKDQHWKHGIENQLKWINFNINEEDIHLIMYCNKNLLGYINLVNRKISLDNDTKGLKVFGIGNVCISKQNQGCGLGTKLIKTVGKLLLDNERIGVLLCRDSMIEFYKKNGWILIEKPRQGEHFKKLNVNVMIFNLNDNFDTIDLLGTSF